jgi:acyl-CoA thioester hydrolase
MPAKFQRTFRVRHYECDAYGHLNNVNYVRYMQEAALDASADVGWDMARYEEVGHQWLIRETEVEYLDALKYDERVTITTWVEDFRRVRSRRRYEFHRLDEDGTQGDMVARASTDWVYLEMATLRPTRIPDDMILAFMPEGAPEAGAKREPFPEAPPVPEGAYVLEKRVPWRDIDSAGHVNNAAYFAYLEDVSTQVGRQFGWSMATMQERGLAMVCRKMRVVYKDSALMDDDLNITTYWSDPKRAFLTRHYTITRPRDGALLAQARGLWVCVDLERQRPTRIPNDMADAFAPNGV